ncbi:MAG: hypothetical protein JOZ45_00110 [Acidobacteriaceae bacterium]|nr:hypothetical protein [Acidobacteriaceae bacterium]
MAAFVRGYLGYRFASTKQVAAMSESFVESIMQFALDHKIDLVRFQKGQRKDDVMQARLRIFRKKHQEGVIFIGVAQEKARVPRTVRKAFSGGGTIPWIHYSSAHVNFYYFYCLDEEFGPFFIKFCSYFPFTAKLCLNGHEYLKCQLEHRGIDYEALDNGIWWCKDLGSAQRICARFDEHKIEGFFRKWLRRLPHPFSAKERQAGYRYELSILQAEFSLTQIWDRALSGRCFFEEVIRENIDLGRPEQVQLIFSRKLKKSTVADGRCRTRILTEGVIPSLHIYYKNTRSKQYLKAAKRRTGLRTETTINDAYDFGIGRRLRNLPALRQIGFEANRRILKVEKLTHDCCIGQQSFQQLQQPAKVEGQHGSALRFGDPRVQALFAVLVLFSLQPQGFRNKELRPLLAQALGLDSPQITPGKMSYDLRRLRLHGLIERIPGTHRYQLTSTGLRTALFYSRAYARVIRPGLSQIANPNFTADSSKLNAAFCRLENQLSAYFAEKKAA